MMSRYYLFHESIKPFDRDKWYVLERGVDYSKQKDIYMVDQKIGTRELVYKADSLPDLLHQIQNSKDWRFYVVTDRYDSRGRYSSEEYPHHRNICTLAGFIPEVCDIRIDKGKPFLGAKWEIEMCRELWVCPSGWDGEEMRKVFYFTEKMDRAVQKLIKKEKLEYGMSEDTDNE